MLVMVMQAVEASGGDNTIALVGAFCTLAGVLGAALITALSKKWRTPKDVVEAKTADDAVNDAIFNRFKELLAESDRKHAEEIQRMREEHARQISGLDRKVDEITEKFTDVKGKNDVLTEYVYHIVRAARKHEFIEHIPEPPHGLGIYL